MKQRDSNKFSAHFPRRRDVCVSVAWCDSLWKSESEAAVHRSYEQQSFAELMVVGGGNARLERIAAMVDWKPLEAALAGVYASATGRPSFPPLAMFKVLLLQHWYGLGDPEMEENLGDRLSFRRFAGLSLHDPVPDHSTLWRFRMELAANGLADRVLAEINRQLEVKGLIVKHGTLIDASLVAARARPGSKPGARDGEPGRASADPDARWGRKGKQSIFGYKIHIGVDAQHTIVRRVAMTDASVTDTERGDELICGDETAVYGDQAYYTHARHARLSEAGIKDRLMRRPNKHHPKLSARHKRRNRLIGRIRSGVERPFAMLKEPLG